MSKKKAAYENPLIPNARVRQMYRGILRAHLLGRALPPSQRALTAAREAALVSTSLDLKSDLTSGDLVSDAISGPVIDFLRGTPLHRALNPKSKSAPGRVVSDCGAATRLPASADSNARIWTALGAAAALQSAAALAKKQSASTESPAKAPSVVLVCTVPGEFSAAAWKAILDFIARHDLPIIFVLLPSTSARTTGSHEARGASRGVDIRAIAHHAHIPAIPVDADDPVALYRVAQESIGHARIGGGPALIECVSFPAQRAAVGSFSPPALAHLEQYMLHRGIATPGWLKSEATTFAAQLARFRPVSK